MTFSGRYDAPAVHRTALVVKEERELRAQNDHVLGPSSETLFDPCRWPRRMRRSRAPCLIFNASRLSSIHHRIFSNF